MHAVGAHGLVDGLAHVGMRECGVAGAAGRLTFYPGFGAGIGPAGVTGGVMREKIAGFVREAFMREKRWKQTVRRLRGQ